MKGFKLDTHVHTEEVSPCGHVPAERMVELYKKAGFDGIIITDHCTSALLRSWGATDWARATEHFLSGYFAAAARGEACGLKVFCGMELQLDCTWPNEYLLFGLTPDLVRTAGPFHQLSQEELRSLARDNDFLIYQAHPFRRGWDFFPGGSNFLDGMEVFNGNPRHDSRNALALAYTLGHGLLCCSGSDAHQVEDVGRGGMLLERAPRDNRDLVDLLKTAELLTSQTTEHFCS